MTKSSLVHLPLFMALGLVWLACQGSPPERTATPAADAAKGGVAVQLDGDMVTLTLTDPGGVPIEELLRATQPIAGCAFTYNRAELSAAAARVRFTGQKRVAKQAMIPLLRDLLQRHGFALIERGQGDTRLFEVVPA